MLVIILGGLVPKGTILSKLRYVVTQPMDHKEQLKNDFLQRRQ